MTMKNQLTEFLQQRINYYEKQLELTETKINEKTIEININKLMLNKKKEYLLTKINFYRERINDVF